MFGRFLESCAHTFGTTAACSRKSADSFSSSFRTSTTRRPIGRSKRGWFWHISHRQINTPSFDISSFDTVTITHPFHPHFEKRFQVVTSNYCWGEHRVAYRDETGSLRSVPASWTDHKPQDIFLEISAGRSIVHAGDLLGLKQLIQSLRGQSRQRQGSDEALDV